MTASRARTVRLSRARALPPPSDVTPTAATTSTHPPRPSHPHPPPPPPLHPSHPPISGVFEDMGGGFLLGATGGFLWHFVKGYRNAPIGQRWAGAFSAARVRAPVLGGQFGVWGGLFSVFDCSLAAIRRREDAWNAIAAGGITGGVLAARAGPRAIARNAAGGAFILAIIEGVMMLFTKIILKAQMSMAGGGKVIVDKLEPPVAPGYASRPSGSVADASFQLQ